MSELKQSASEGQITVDSEDAECLTIISPAANITLFEFHRQRLAEKGYTISSRITKHRFQLATEDGSVTDLIDGKSYYAATYSKRKK